MASGGKRLNSGRPKGSQNKLLARRKIQDYFTEKEVIKLIEDVKKDPKLKAFIVEQLFGKAPQRIEMTGADGGNILIQISKEIADKNGINSSTISNS